MSEQNPFGWASEAGADARKSELARQAKVEADAAARAQQAQIQRHLLQESKKKASDLLLNVSNQIQLAVNAFNKDAGDIISIDSPVADGDLRYVITRREFSNIQGLRQPVRVIQTSFEFLLETSEIHVEECYVKNKQGQVNYRPSDTFLIKFESDGRTTIRSGLRVIGQDGLVEQICLPLFKFKEQTR